MHGQTHSAGNRDTVAIVHEDRPMSSKKKVIASSLGTVFEWYDYLVRLVGGHNCQRLRASWTKVLVDLRAVGVCGRFHRASVWCDFLWPLGRHDWPQNTFLVTILIMGLSTFIVGVLPTYASIGVAAPVILIALRLLQGSGLGRANMAALPPTWQNARAARQTWRLHLLDPNHRRRHLGFVLVPAGDFGHAYRDGRRSF